MDEEEEEKEVEVEVEEGRTSGFLKAGHISGFPAARCARLDPSMSGKSLFERGRKKGKENKQFTHEKPSH